MAKYSCPSEYIDNQIQFKELLLALDMIITDGGLDPHIKWGAPCYTYKGKNVVGLAAFKEYVAIWFFQGSLLEDKSKMLINANEGVTKALRQWRFTSTTEINRSLILQYIQESIANFQLGRTIKVSRDRKEIVLPAEIESAIKKDKALKLAFTELSYSCKKEYAQYVAEAKKEETRVRRLEKIIPMIIEHRGINDKYKK